MSNIEHYFENLLFHGKDCKDEPNRKSLTEDVQHAVEECAQYVKYTLFYRGVIRCKDCEDYDSGVSYQGWCNLHDTLLCDYDFCSYGQKRTQRGDEHI